MRGTDVRSMNFEEYETRKRKMENRKPRQEKIFENSSRSNFQVVTYAARYILMARVFLMGKETLHARKVTIETTTPLT